MCKTFRPPYECMQLCVLDGYLRYGCIVNTIPKEITGHRPVIVKRAVIGSKSGWKLSTIFLSCKVFHDWSIIKIGNILYL